MRKAFRVCLVAILLLIGIGEAAQASAQAIIVQRRGPYHRRYYRPHPYRRYHRPYAYRHRYVRPYRRY